MYHRNSEKIILSSREYRPDPTFLQEFLSNTIAEKKKLEKVKAAKELKQPELDENFEQEVKLRKLELHYQSELVKIPSEG